MKRTKEKEEKKSRHWFSFQNFVNYQLDPQVAPKEGASCFASSNSFPSKNIFTAEAPHCPACSSSKPARIWTPTIKSSLFEGCRQISNLIKYLWDITANVMTQGATSAGAIHSDFEHLIPCKFAATLAWKMIAGNRVTQSWERDGSPLQRYPGDLQKWANSPKRRGFKSWRWWQLWEELIWPACDGCKAQHIR